MDRRGFLGAILAAGVAPAFIRIGNLMPVQRIVLPYEAGWVSAVGGNQLLSIDVITREALRVLHKNLQFVSTVNKQFDSDFITAGDVITIGRPVRYG